jgi:SAM-dependent methyltransferase
LSADFDHAYFENLYAENPDPWRYETSFYEREKYTKTIDALPRVTYRRALELGCSIGVLTERLCPICDRITSVDTSTRALMAARDRCPYLHVSFLQAHLPDGDWGDGYDLVVLSELLYYLDRDAIAALGARLTRSVTKGAHILLVHWTGETGGPLTADEATAALEETLPVAVIHQQREPKYRLDVWQVIRGAEGTRAHRFKL